jgi:hypothetical protein
MGVYHYFYKSDTDKESFEDGKFTGIPDNFTKYKLESVNNYQKDCIVYKNIGNSSCLCCNCSSETRYKITREKAKEISKDMDTNQTLFEDLMNDIGQDYIWINLDY